MPRGGARPGAGRPRKVPAVYDSGEVPDAVNAELTPIEYMMQVMRDQSADASRRDRMAVALAPFVHAKKGELGKKDERKNAAKVAATGKFAPADPPKLVVHNRGK